MLLPLNAESDLPRERAGQLVEVSAEHEVLEQNAAWLAWSLKRASAQEVLHEQHAFRGACLYFARACQT